MKRVIVAFVLGFSLGILGLKRAIEEGTVQIIDGEVVAVNR